LNYYLLTPEICLAGAAIAIILLDLVVGRKGILLFVGIAALVASIVVSVALWGEQDNSLFNGMIKADEFAIFFKVLISGAAILVLLASKDYVSKFSRFQGEYYGLILLSVVGMMLMAASRDLITIYVSLELTSISLYALVGFLKDPKSSEAGLKYLLLGAIASAILLYGMALIFGITGETGLSEIAAALPAGRIWETPLLLMGLIFLIGGFGFKIATVPFQMWVPDVYEGAPTTITAYLSVASKAAGFAVVLRVFLEAFGGDVLRDWAMIFAVLGAISMTLGNVIAISQNNIKRMLGYSSIAQAGYLMVGLAAVTKAAEVNDPALFGPTGLIFFLGCYALANLGAFIAIIAITNKTQSDAIDDFAGMGSRAPVIALALTLCLVSLTGVPPTAGFLAKFYLFGAAVQHDLVWLVIIGVLNSVVSAYYYLRVVKVMWFGTPTSEEKVPSSLALRVALAIACLGVLVLFFYPSPLLDVARDAAQTVSGMVLP
jgi:NADH-quinone oxidoreductase subunit N